MGKLFDRMTEMASLWAAWEKVRSNRGAPGPDGERIGTFAETLTRRLERLQRSLRAGTYRPGPVRLVEIPKRQGQGVRVLSIPNVEDRIVQTAIASVLTPVLEAEFEDDSYAYRAGRSVAMAVRRVAHLRSVGYTHVLDADITAYFDRVPHAPLKRCLAQYVKDAQILDLVSAWLSTFREAGRGIPQGSPLSPLLANLYLDALDEAVSEAGLKIVRFADDFVVLARNSKDARKARETVAETLSELGLELHPEKTRLVSFEESFRFLGHLFLRDLVMASSGTPADPPRPARQAAGARIPQGSPDELPFEVMNDQGDDPEDPLVLADEPPPKPEPDMEQDPFRSSQHSPGARIVYLMGRGHRLARRNQAFSLQDPMGSELAALPQGWADRIDIGPEAQAGMDAIRLAIETETELAFVGSRGETLAMLSPPQDGHAALHLAQSRHILDEGLRLELARRVVDARLRNQRALLRRLNRRRKDEAVADAAHRIGRILLKLNIAGSIPALMGIEGEAAACYWPAFGKCLGGNWVFRHRRRRPPPDPVNLVLSFFSSLLARDIRTMTQRCGLHPGFGVLHSARDGQDALVSDLIEPLRAPVVESLTAYVFNNRIVTKADFTKSSSTEAYAFPEAVGRLIREYEAKIDSPAVSPWTGERMKWRRLFHQQAMAYKAHLLDPASPFMPYVMDH